MLTIAALAGRQLIVHELVREAGAGLPLLHEKNRDLMSPLQLANPNPNPDPNPKPSPKPKPNPSPNPN